MADYLYTSMGEPQGFRLGDFIFAMDGRPIGKVFAEKAYALDGEYVGLIVNNMVLNKPGVSRRNMPPVTNLPPAEPPRLGEHRRPVCEAYADCFERLLPLRQEEAPAEMAAAED